MLRADLLHVSSTDPNADTATLWDILARDVGRYLAKRVEPEAVDDLRQEVFARVHSHRTDLREGTAVAGWVLRIAHNVAIDHLRRRRDTSPLSEHQPEPATEPDDADAAAAILGPWLAATVQTLPEHYAEAVRLVELEGMSQKDAAQRLGLSYSAMKSRVQRGRALLRKSLLRCCEIERDARGRVIDFRPRSCDPGDGCC